MRIVLIGAGEVGYNVARDLASDGHDIIVVENNEERALRAENELDAIVIRGNGARPSVLNRAGVKDGCRDIPLLIACTNKDEVNIMACWIAKKMGVPHVIARAVGLEFTDNDTWAKDLGIDMFISPERSVAKEIEELLEVRGALHTAELAGGKAGIYVFRVADDSPMCGLPLFEVRKRNKSLITLIVCIQREGKSFVPKAKEILRPGDICYTMCYREQIHEIESLFQPMLTKKLKRVLIIGAGKIGFQAAKRLIDRIPRIDIRIIEQDRAKCEKVAPGLPGVLVICGDGADSELLLAEGIASSDGFVAATDQDETNLMLAVLGKTLGSSKSIAVVKRPNYLGMTKYIPVDSILNRNQTIAEVIIRNVRYPGSSRVLTVLEEISAEALELILSERSPAAWKALKDVDLPDGAIIGLLERGSDFLIPTGTTELKPGDKIVVFASTDTMPSAIQQLGEPLK
ncbi:MAG: Trk system potassium transporter TrkA [Synergistaceae bacterium]|nr:Trk system potassium transporter TrkA [Synergistaceae bacterium]